MNTQHPIEYEREMYTFLATQPWTLKEIIIL